ncbi:unnamed protein product, partial [Brassica rapa subsp. trilocularis]
MKVYINGLQPLICKTTLEFDDGGEVEATLVYERLHNHCSTCYSLCHGKEECPEDQSGATSLQQSSQKNQRLSTDHQNSKNSRRSSAELASSQHRAPPPHPQRHSYGRPASKGYYSSDAERTQFRADSHADSRRLKNPPSTERTITARNPPRDRTYHLTRRGEESTNSYHSREYRRHDTPERRRAPQHHQQSKSLWVEKSKQCEAQSQNELERTESSLPILTTGQRNEVQNLSQNLPSAALDIAREEIREVMIQYSSCPDPTESAARKTRLRQAEEQGELEEAAAQLVRNSIEMQRMDITEERVEVTPERIPALQRLGQGSEPRSALHRLGPHENSTPRSVQPTIRKKTASQGAKRLTPSSLAPMGAGIRKRKVAKAAPSPRHRSSNLSKTIPRNEENNPKNKTTKAGPTILWKEWLQLDVISSCNNYFDTRISYEGKVSYVTFVY